MQQRLPGTAAAHLTDGCRQVPFLSTDAFSHQRSSEGRRRRQSARAPQRHVVMALRAPGGPRRALRPRRPETLRRDARPSPGRPSAPAAGTRNTRSRGAAQPRPRTPPRRPARGRASPLCAPSAVQRSGAPPESPPRSPASGRAAATTDPGT